MSRTAAALALVASDGIPRQGSPDAECQCAPCKDRRRRKAAPRRRKDPDQLGQFIKQMLRLVRRDAAAVAEPLDVLPVLAQLSRAIDEEMHTTVRALRAGPAPYTWEQIGEALGIKKQSAQERFGGDQP